MVPSNIEMKTALGSEHDKQKKMKSFSCLLELRVYYPELEKSKSLIIRSKVDLNKLPQVS